MWDHCLAQDRETVSIEEFVWVTAATEFVYYTFFEDMCHPVLTNNVLTYPTIDLPNYEARLEKQSAYVKVTLEDMSGLTYYERKYLIYSFVKSSHSLPGDRIIIFPLVADECIRFVLTFRRLGKVSTPRISFRSCLRCEAACARGKMLLATPGGGSSESVPACRVAWCVPLPVIITPYTTL